MGHLRIISIHLSIAASGRGEFLEGWWHVHRARVDEREEENVCSFLLPWEEFGVPLCRAVKAILVVISQQDIESKHLAWPSWVGTILHFQPGVSLLVACVLVGTTTWTVSVPVPVAVVVIVLVCVGVAASIMGVSMAVVAGVCVACIATSMISCVASMAPM